MFPNMDSQTTKVLQDLSAMMKSPGWQQLIKDFSFRIRNLQDEINELGGNEMIMSTNDIKKTELKILKEIINYPDRYISQMISPSKSPQNMDPYEEEKIENDDPDLDEI